MADSLFRNFKNCLGIDDEELRKKILLCRNVFELERFAQKYPLLFMTEGDFIETPLIPLELLVAYVQNHYANRGFTPSREQRFKSLHLDKAWDLLPELEYIETYEFSRIQECDDSEILDDFARQLYGQLVKPGMLVQYEGKSFVVLSVETKIELELGKEFPENVTLESLNMVYREYLDLDKNYRSFNFN